MANKPAFQKVSQKSRMCVAVNAFTIMAAIIGSLGVSMVHFRNPPWHYYGGLDLDTWRLAIAYCMINIVLLLVFWIAKSISRWAFWFGIAAQLLFIIQLADRFKEGYTYGTV